MCFGLFDSKQFNLLDVWACGSLCLANENGDADDDEDKIGLVFDDTVMDNEKYQMWLVLNNMDECDYESERDDNDKEDDIENDGVESEDADENSSKINNYYDCLLGHASCLVCSFFFDFLR